MNVLLAKTVNIQSSYYLLKLGCTYDINIQHLIKMFIDLMHFKEIFTPLDSIECIKGEFKLNSKGSIFSFYINSKPSIFTIDDMVQTDHFYKLKFLFSTLFDDNIRFIINFKFYSLTVEQATYFSMELIYESKRDLVHFLNHLPVSVIMESLGNIYEKLSKRKEYIENTCIVNTNIMDLWGVISNWKILMNYCPKLFDYIEYPSTSMYDKIKIIKNNKVLYIRIKTSKLEAFRGLFIVNIYKEKSLIQKMIFKLTSLADRSYVYIKYIKLKKKHYDFLIDVHELIWGLNQYYENQMKNFIS
jgi:hypothetical protein